MKNSSDGRRRHRGHALGLPVVASDVPAVREVTEDGRNALLVAPGDVSALAEALDALLDDSERRAAFSKRSRVIYEERFTLDRIVERMVELYHQVAGLRRPAAAHVA